MFISGKPTTVAHRDQVTGVANRESVKKEEAVSLIVDHIRDKNVRLGDEELKNIAEMVYDESMRYNVDYRLVLAIMKIESNFKHDAVSHKGARGLLRSSHPAPSILPPMQGSNGEAPRPSMSRRKISRSGSTSSHPLSRISKASIWPSMPTTLDLPDSKRYLLKINDLKNAT